MEEKKTDKAVSIICSTYNRAKYLRRSIETWTKQNFPLPYEIIIVDDRSEDNTEQLVNSYKGKANVTYIKLSGKKGFRGHTVGYNRALCEARGKFCVFTHPEIMFPPDLLAKTYRAFDNQGLIRRALEEEHRMDYITVKPFWLPQVDVDEVDWRDNIYRLLSFLDFNQEMEGLPIDYRSQTMMLRNEWGSTTTFAMRRNDLKNIGGFFEFDMWGPDDINMSQRRNMFNMKSGIVQGCFVFHQNHDNDSKSSKREPMATVFKNCPKMKTLADAHGPLNISDFK